MGREMELPQAGARERDKEPGHGRLRKGWRVVKSRGGVRGQGWLCLQLVAELLLPPGRLPESKASAHRALHLRACSSETGSVLRSWTPSAAGEGRKHGGWNYLSSLKPGFLQAWQVGVCTHSGEHCGMLAVARDPQAHSSSFSSSFLPTGERGAVTLGAGRVKGWGRCLTWPQAEPLRQDGEALVRARTLPCSSHS